MNGVDKQTTNRRCIGTQARNKWTLKFRSRAILAFLFVLCFSLVNFVVKYERTDRLNLDAILDFVFFAFMYGVFLALALLARKRNVVTRRDQPVKKTALSFRSRAILAFLGGLCLSLVSYGARFTRPRTIRHALLHFGSFVCPYGVLLALALLHRRRVNPE